MLLAAFCAVAAAWQIGQGTHLPGVQLASRSARRSSIPVATNTEASQALADAAALVGYDNFVRTNPHSDRFETREFHHVELYCADASSAAARFSHALGMDLVARSDAPTEHSGFCSLCVRSGEVRFVFSAPRRHERAPPPDAPQSQFGFDPELAHHFLETHGGLAVRAIGIEVKNVDAAFAACVSGGGTPVLAPRPLRDGVAVRGAMAEVALYGDVVLRLLSIDSNWTGAHLPGYENLSTATDAPSDYGVERFDHIVGNVRELLPTVRHLQAMTGFHEFAEFTAEDVGTVDSGLNSMVLASNDERVLLPVNEPTYGTRRRCESPAHPYALRHRSACLRSTPCKQHSRKRQTVTRHMGSVRTPAHMSAPARLPLIVAPRWHGSWA